jgi:hypothetical protein
LYQDHQVTQTPQKVIKLEDFILGHF